MLSLEKHVARLQSLGFDQEMAKLFSKEWSLLADGGYEMNAIYTGADGSPLEGRKACVICSKSDFILHWKNVITPSQDSAAIYSVCNNCDDQYVETAIRQKALGRLLKERNTRPS
ncbi:MAG: hypothetical protein E6K88_00770 [Thaumarchaeota archaeon]|nr:MAG: hypothetical protein E6K88_00770 [Nitrososphaerota archaeon]